MTRTLRLASLRRNVSSLVWLALLAVNLAVLVAWLDPALAWKAGLERQPIWELAALGMLPFLLIVLALCALTRRVLLSSWIGLLLLVGTLLANAIKVEQLDLPLLPGDFHFLDNLGAALPLFAHYFSHGGIAILVAVAVLAISVALAWEKPWPALRGGWRLGLGLVTITLGAGLFAGWAPWRSIYSAERLRFAPWSVVDSANKAGAIGNLVLYNWELARRQTLHPDRKAAERLLSQRAEAVRTQLLPNQSALAMPADTLPDIVFVQSESLFDPARLRGAAKDVYLPNFHRLARRGLSGNMKVPTYAGGTIRTEFEVLTGLALAFFPGVQYPYFEIADQPIPGIVRLLESRGYQTTAIHPNSGVFWNRRQAYEQIGFDRFIDDAAFSKDEIVGLFIGDAALTDRILAELDADGPPQMIFAVSMENHGPFDWRPGLDSQRLANQPMPPGLDEGGEYWLRNYLYLLEDADHELGRLAAAIQQRKRRTVLVFYGDHLPALPPVYHQIGFVDGRGAKEQPVPYLILDNGRSLHQTAPLDTTAWLLPSLVLETAGIGGDRYFATLNVLRGEVPANVMDLTTDLPAELRALGQLRFRNELDPLLDTALAQPAASTAAPLTP